MEIIDSIKSFSKKAPKLYNLILLLTSHIYFYGLSAEKALKKCFPNGISNKKIINLGSGTSNFGKNVINVDTFPHKNVNVVTDATDTPFNNGSIDMIISRSVLEHMPDPELAIQEMKRILRPKGFVFIEMPFVFPFHGSPSDYTRFTIQGLKERFKDFEIIQSGARSGPIAALVIQIMYILALLLSFGSKKFYSLLLSFFMVALSPLKALDFLTMPFPKSEESASHIYFLAKKRNNK